MENIIDEIFRYTTSVSSFILHIILSHVEISIFCALLNHFHFSYVAFVAIKREILPATDYTFFFFTNISVTLIKRRLSKSLRKVSMDSVARERATDPPQF